MPSRSGGGDEDGDGHGERELIRSVPPTAHWFVMYGGLINLRFGGRWTTGGLLGKLKFG